MNRFWDIFFHELGFKSLSDFSKSIFGFKSFVFIIAQIAGSLFSIIMGFTKEWIWDPPSAAIVFVSLILSESFTGTYVAVVIKKEKFDFRKFYNIAPKVVAHIFLLSASFQLGKYSAFLNFWLPNAVFGWFTTRNLIATLLNLIEMKLVKGEFFSYLKKKLGAQDSELLESIERDIKDGK